MPDMPPFAPFRRWQTSARTPMLKPLILAADTRLSDTDPADDQVWALILNGESAAVALQTRYGGRAGLVALLPMWEIDGRLLTRDFASLPVVTALAPGYARVEARLTPGLALTAEFWVMESHAVGGRLTLANDGQQTTPLNVKLAGFVGMDGKEAALSVHPLSGDNSRHALSLNTLGNLRPVVLLEGGSADAAPGMRRLTAPLTVPPGEQRAIRFVCAGQPTFAASLASAQRWLGEKWDTAFERIASTALAIPEIETGSADWDALIALSYSQLLQGFLRATAYLPHPSPVATRTPDRGFSFGGDGMRGGSGQTHTLAYLAALAVAPVDRVLAEGIVRNYLAVQTDDGSIDRAPGLAGQRTGDLCPPILARLAWGIFQYSEHDSFLREVYPGLLRHFRRWFADDRDHDGVPEWHSEGQIGLNTLPTFGAFTKWGQGAAVEAVESPDLIAYLLSEAISLHEIGYYLREPAEPFLREQIAALTAALDSFWHSDLARFAYRDRDTHTTAPAVPLLVDGRGGEEQFIAELLNPPARLIVTIEGGVDHRPDVRLIIEGRDAADKPLREVAETGEIAWYRGRGLYTTQAVFSTVDRLQTEGLVRVYRVSVSTLDTSRLDITALLVLWPPIAAIDLPPERVVALLALLESAFMTPSGISVGALSDPAYSPTGTDGIGGVWPFFHTLIGEGLIENGHMQAATELARRLLDAQTQVVNAEGTFYEFYASDVSAGAAPHGSGERGHLAGIAPLHLLMRVFGVRVISPSLVWTGGEFYWPYPVTVRQHGVTVRRSVEGTAITFPSGYTVSLEANAPMQELHDRAAPETRGESELRTTTDASDADTSNLDTRAPDTGDTAP